MPKARPWPDVADCPVCLQPVPPRPGTVRGTLWLVDCTRFGVDGPACHGCYQRLHWNAGRRVPDPVAVVVDRLRRGETARPGPAPRPPLARRRDDEPALPRDPDAADAALLALRAKCLEVLIERVEAGGRAGLPPPKPKPPPKPGGGRPVGRELVRAVTEPLRCRAFHEFFEVGSGSAPGGEPAPDGHPWRERTVNRG